MTSPLDERPSGPAPEQPHPGPSFTDRTAALPDANPQPPQGSYPHQPGAYPTQPLPGQGGQPYLGQQPLAAAPPWEAPQTATAAGPIPGGKVVERAHPLTPLVRGWVALVAVGWAVLQEQMPGRQASRGEVPWWVFGAGVVAVALVALIAGFVSWRFTRFIADETELTVESGWISRRSRRISYTRIQSVDVMQPLAPRILGLAEVSIDAGAKDSTKLRYLSRKRAYELRDFLMMRAHGAQVSVQEARTQTADPLFADLTERDHVVVTVAPQELLLGAVVSHELLITLIAFGLPFGIVWGMSTYTSLPTEDLLPVVALASGVPMVIAIGQYFARRVAAQFNFTLAHTQAGLRLTRGLTSLTSQTVPVKRIQSIRISQPLFWRPLQRFRVDLEVLGLGEATTNESSSNASTLLLPIGTYQQVEAVLDAVWPGLSLARIQFVSSPPAARWLDPLAYSWNGFGLDDQVVVSRRGWLIRHQSIVPHARLQSVAADQGPVERMLGLANVAFHTTGLLHQHAVIHVDAERARALVYDEADRAMSSRDAELLARPATAT